MDVAARDDARSAVLVLDDDPQLRDIVGQTLEVANYDPVLVGDTADAVAAARSHAPAAIVADVVDDWTGVGRIRLIDQLAEAAPGVPIILCSGRSEAELLDPVQNGLFAILPKPFEMPVLLRTVERAITAAAARRPN